MLLDIVYNSRVDEGRVGESPRLFETEDEDTRGRRLNYNIGIAKTFFSLEWDEDITCGAGISWVHLNSSKERSSGLGDADEKQDDGSQDRSVNAELDRVEDRNEDACKPDEEFQRRDEPEGVHLGWRRDEIGDGVNDDGGKTGEGDIEESVGETVQGDDDDDSGDPTSCRGSHTALGLEGRAREGTGSGQCGEEGSDRVRHSDGNQFLVGVDLVTVDATEGLGDGNMLQKQNDGGDEQF